MSNYGIMSLFIYSYQNNDVGKTAAGMSFPSGARHLRAAARRQAAAPLVAVDLRLLRQVLLRGAPSRHALRPATQEPD